MRNRVVAFVFVLSAVAVTLTACGGTNSNVQTTPPPTASLSASPVSVVAGNQTILTYSCGNSTSCVLTAPGGLSVTLQAMSGTQTESPTATTTYTLTASGSGGTTTATAIVTVTTAVTVPKPTITGNIGIATLGQSILLSWNCDTGTTVSVSGPGMATSSACTGTNVSATPTAVGSAVHDYVGE